ncbi:MAG TPA: hypothetical protein VFC23_21660 [Thermoanaerobaculia bacterium]|nr:hypothetical protein [Thermoanaerobaculia bacterium]
MSPEESVMAMSEEHWSEVLDVLQDVPEDRKRRLLHILACPECRDKVETILGTALFLKGRRALSEALYDPLFGAIEVKTPGLLVQLLAAKSEAEGEAERLLAELLARSERARRYATRWERYQHLGLVDLLLARSHKIQLERPLEAAGLARLAGQLIGEMAAERVADREGYRVRALALAGNGLRLAGRLQEASAVLQKASLELRDVSKHEERGILCRYLGLLRWEQRRVAEGLALIGHARACFQESGEKREALTCRALQGLLLLEEERQVEGAWSYLQFLCWDGFYPESLLGLRVRAFLGAALCVAVAGDKNAAKAFLKRACHLYPSLNDDSSAMVRAHWLEGRVRAELREDGAYGLLQSVREKFFEWEWLFEATLVSGDMLVSLGWAQRLTDAEALINETVSRLGGFKGALSVVSPLRELARSAAAGEVRLWEAMMSSFLRELFVFYGRRPQPVSFA